MIYCDASLLVTSLTAEPRTKAVLHWLAGHDAGTLCFSHWAITEVSSALALKHRRGDLDAGDYAQARSYWRQRQQDLFESIPVSEEAFTLAAQFCSMSGTNLRAGDALHLAVASLGGHSLATLDERMAEAALSAGVRVAAM